MNPAGIQPPSLRVLVVDDDPIASMICCALLKEAGFEPHRAGNVPEARKVLEDMGSTAFVAVVCDYHMPGEDGLALLSHLRSHDSTLGVIMVTAESEKLLITRSLRSGAIDFLEKPINGKELLAAVSRAAEETLCRRKLNTVATEVNYVASSQRALLGQSTARLTGRFRVVFHPHEQAGGDFVAAFPIGRRRYLALVSDVSGHNLEAAYRSAYLQGFARAMLVNGLTPSNTFGQLNQLLLNEWNADGGDMFSMAACVADVDLKEGTLTLLNCGLPPPILIDPMGNVRILSANTSSPLGWFKDLPREQRIPLEGGWLQFWSDGIDDLALELGVTSLSLSHRLHMDPQAIYEFSERAADDIISVQLDLSATPTGTGFSGPFPIVAEWFHQADEHRIDEIQELCERSIIMALGNLAEASMHDILMCLREALLNALQHGCSASPTQRAWLQIAYNPVNRELRINITDEGKGYDFDFQAYEDIASNQLLTEHRGLLMIKHLAKRFDILSNGTALEMGFDLSLLSPSP
jgi:FixJ family two-component response regulator/anti-sigma regulatory factor (Ser/Thr protein kinase)